MNVPRLQTPFPAAFHTERRCVADQGASFSDGDTRAFPGQPGTDTQGAMVFAQGPRQFLVGSPWGKDHFPRRNYTVLVSDAVDGRPSSWRALPGADPLWAGAAEYSTLMVPSGGDGKSVWAIYERSASLGSQNGNEVLRLTQLRLP